MTNEERQEHIEQLGCELGCVIVQSPRMPGMMFVEYEPPLIEGPTVFSQSDYLTMLHELGHVAHGHTQGRPPYDDKKYYFENGVLRSEAEAWQWALDNCTEELTSQSRAFMWHTCMGSYWRGSLVAGGRSGQQLWNGNRHHVRFKYDEPDAFFWGVAERIWGDVISPPEHYLNRKALIAA